MKENLEYIYLDMKTHANNTESLVKTETLLVSDGWECYHTYDNTRLEIHYKFFRKKI